MVVDASVALKWVLPEDLSETAAALLSGPEPMIAPAFWLVEAANALWRRVRSAELTASEALALQSVLCTAPLSAREDAPLIAAALELASALSHPIYDCLYLALALRERAALVTADAKFAAAVRRGPYGATIRVLGEASAQP